LRAVTRETLAKACAALIICFMTMWIAPGAFAQETVHGRVHYIAEGDTIPLPFAHVRIADTPSGTTADSTGRFTLEVPANAVLIVSHVEFEPDTVRVEGDRRLRIALRRIRTLEEVDVTGERKATSIAPIEIKTEVISRKELLKAPCCDLAGCFSTNTSVEPVVTDVIINTKELRMIGLSGVYTQILVDTSPR